MNSFQIAGIDHRQFEPLFHLTDGELRAQGAMRSIVEKDFGTPCRVSLEDARAGEEVLLLPYLHQPGDSPYRSTGPIFVRRGAQRRVATVGELPPYVTRRLMSVRAYDTSHMMVEATVCEGADTAVVIEKQFANPAIAYIHLHNAKPGCFSCRVDRA